MAKEFSTKMKRLTAQFDNNTDLIKQMDKEAEDKKKSLENIFHEAVRSENIKEVEGLRENPNIDVNSRNVQGKNALDISIDSGNPDLVSILLNYPAIKNSSLDNALKRALDDTAQNKKIKNYDSSQKNNFEIIKQLVDKGANCSRDSFTKAVLANKIEIVRLLTQRTKNRHIEDNIIKNTDIFIEAWEQNVSNDILRELAMHGANVNYYPRGEKRFNSGAKNNNLYNTNFLYDSLSKQDVEKTNILLTYGADPWLPNNSKEGKTPENLIQQLNNKKINEVFEKAKTQIVKAAGIMREIKTLQKVPTHYNDEQLNQLMTLLNNGTLTYLIKKEDNLGETTAGIAKSNVIIEQVQGTIRKHLNTKKRASEMDSAIKQKALETAGVIISKHLTARDSNSTPPPRTTFSGRKSPSPNQAK